MKIPDKFYFIREENFNEDLKWSCHSYLHKSVLNIEQHFGSEQQSKILQVNERDITGKFNAPNFLLHIYLYHSVNRFRSYPANQDATADFILILKDLIHHQALLDIPDWTGNTFLENYGQVHNSNPNIYKKEISFMKVDAIACLSNDDLFKDYLKSVSAINKFYLFNAVEKELKTNDIQIKKHKV